MTGNLILHFYFYVATTATPATWWHGSGDELPDDEPSGAARCLPAPAAADASEEFDAQLDADQPASRQDPAAGRRQLGRPKNLRE